MSFQTSCMVLIPTVRQQIELGKWMADIGRPVKQLNRDQPRLLLAFAIANSNPSFWAPPEEQKREAMARECINCGENIEIFKALAAMNSDNDREQWFVAHAVIRFERLKDTVQTETGERLIMAGDWFKVLIPRASDIRAKWMAAVAPKQLCHKATKDEIIEHFRN